MLGKILMNWCRRQAAWRRALGNLRSAGRPCPPDPVAGPHPRKRMPTGRRFI